MQINIIDSSWHRNGITGNGFYAILFDWTEEGKTCRMVATLFNEPGSCAVLEVAGLTGEAMVTFGKNSWRGDHFEDELRRLAKETVNNKLGPFSIPAFL